jgi:hypothetical protein
MPIAETSPAARPWPTLRLTMYSTAGPGMSRKTMELVTKRSKEA